MPASFKIRLSPLSQKCHFICIKTTQSPMAFQKFANKTTMNLFPINTLPSSCPLEFRVRLQFQRDVSGGTRIPLRVVSGHPTRRRWARPVNPRRANKFRSRLSEGSASDDGESILSLCPSAAKKRERVACQTDFSPFRALAPL